jgi:hypothetical protein
MLNWTPGPLHEYAASAADAAAVENARGAQFVNRSSGVWLGTQVVRSLIAVRAVAALALLVYDILLTTDEEVSGDVCGEKCLANATR